MNEDLSDGSELLQLDETIHEEFPDELQLRLCVWDRCSRASDCGFRFPDTELVDTESPGMGSDELLQTVTIRDRELETLERGFSTDTAVPLRMEDSEDIPLFLLLCSLAFSILCRQPSRERGNSRSTISQDRSARSPGTS